MDELRLHHHDLNWSESLLEFFTKCLLVATVHKSASTVKYMRLPSQSRVQMDELVCVRKKSLFAESF